MHALSAVYTLWKKDPSYVFVAMGTATPEWQTYVRNVDPDCVRDLSYKTGREKEAFFALADIYCMPSATETFGLTYVEAWHKKKPVIGADFPAVSELIIKNAGGITVQYGNTEAIASTITKLIRNPVLSRELGINGYHALMTRYTLDGMLSKYIRLFKGQTV
jgi:glycosyltransferase involved in cell wall biosynthesis